MGHLLLSKRLKNDWFKNGLSSNEFCKVFVFALGLAIGGYLSCHSPYTRPRFMQDKRRDLGVESRIHFLLSKPYCGSVKLPSKPIWVSQE